MPGRGGAAEGRGPALLPAGDAGDRDDRRPARPPPAGLGAPMAASGDPWRGVREARAGLLPALRTHRRSGGDPTVLQGIPTALARLPMTPTRLPGASGQLPIALRRLPSASGRAPSALRRLPSALRRLPSASGCVSSASGWVPSDLGLATRAHDLPRCLPAGDEGPCGEQPRGGRSRSAEPSTPAHRSSAGGKPSAVCGVVG